MKAHRAERVGEHARGMRIVRDVENHRRASGQHLEAPRQLDSPRVRARIALAAHRQAVAQQRRAPRAPSLHWRADGRRAARETAGRERAPRRTAVSPLQCLGRHERVVAADAPQRRADRVRVRDERSPADRRRRRPPGDRRGRSPPSRGRCPRASSRDSRRDRCRSSSRRRRRHRRCSRRRAGRRARLRARARRASRAANSHSAASVPNSKYVSGDSPH